MTSLFNWQTQNNKINNFEVLWDDSKTCFRDGNAGNIEKVYY